MPKSKHEVITKAIPVILFSLLLFCAFSCKKGIEPIYYRETIKNLVDYDFEGEIPPPPTPDIYAKTKQDSICMTSVAALYHSYKNEYKKFYKKDFETFLFEIMNQHKKLNGCVLYNPSECFKPSQKILTEYNKTGFGQILEKYFEKDSSRTLKNHNSLSYEEINTIGYICYLNKYYLSFDDYRGFYHIYKPHF